LAWLYLRPLYRSAAAELRDAGLELRNLTAPDALIIAADNGDPTIFYYAERRGWHFLERRNLPGQSDRQPAADCRSCETKEPWRDVSCFHNQHVLVARVLS